MLVTYHINSEKLFRMMEASLQQFRQIVVLSSTYEAGNGGTCQWTGAGVQIVQQDAKCVRIEFNNGEFGLCKFCTVHFLCVSAHGESRHRQLWHYALLLAIFIFALLICKQK